MMVVQGCRNSTQIQGLTRELRISLHSASNRSSR